MTKRKGYQGKVSIKERFRYLFTHNLRRRFSRDQLQEVAGRDKPRWHQRISELRTDDGYTIKQARHENTSWYAMPHADCRDMTASRFPLDKYRDGLIERDGDTCALCCVKDGEMSERTTTKVTLQPDHIIPHAHGGKDSMSNLQLLCQPCNLFKKEHYRPPEKTVLAAVSLADRHTKLLVYEKLQAEFAEERGDGGSQ